MTGRELKPRSPRAGVLDTVQTGRVDWRLGRAMRVSVRVQITPAGLLAIGAMVSAMLLSSAEIVRAARRR